jgi:hypothetical protein
MKMYRDFLRIINYYIKTIQYNMKDFLNVCKCVFADVLFDI